MELQQVIFIPGNLVGNNQMLGTLTEILPGGTKTDTGPLASGSLGQLSAQKIVKTLWKRQ